MAADSSKGCEEDDSEATQQQGQCSMPGHCDGLGHCDEPAAQEGAEQAWHGNAGMAERNVSRVKTEDVDVTGEALEAQVDVGAEVGFSSAASLQHASAADAAIGTTPHSNGAQQGASDVRMHAPQPCEGDEEQELDIMGGAAWQQGAGQQQAGSDELDITTEAAPGQHEGQGVPEPETSSAGAAGAQDAAPDQPRQQLRDAPQRRIAPPPAQAAPVPMCLQVQTHNTLL